MHEAVCNRKKSATGFNCDTTGLLVHWVVVYWVVVMMVVLSYRVQWGYDRSYRPACN